MAIAQRGSATTNTAGSATTIGNLAKPTGVVDNDILVLHLYKENQNALTTDPPTGWTALQTTNFGTGLQLRTFYKRASSEGANYNGICQWSGSVWQHAILVAYSGCLTSGSPLDGTPSTNSGTTNIIDDPACISTAITTTAANSLVIATAANLHGSTLTQPSGMTAANSSHDGGMTAHVLQASAGFTGNKTWSGLDGSNDWAAQLFALKDASGGAATKGLPFRAQPLRLWTRRQ